MAIPNYLTGIVDTRQIRFGYWNLQSAGEREYALAICSSIPALEMLDYPIILEYEENTVLVTSPDFLELTTFGDEFGEAQARALDALEEAIAARIHDRRDIPTPSPGGDARVTLPTLTAVKVILYQGMRDQRITKTDLARRLGWHLPQVDRVLDVNHHSRLDQMDAALQAIGCRLSVSPVSSTPEVART